MHDQSYRQGWDLTVDTPLVSVVATFRLSCVGVDREPSQCSLKYGRFQAYVPVVVTRKEGGGLWAGGASYPWEWNAFPFVALQFLTVLPQHMSMMGLVLLSCFPHPPFSIQSNLVLPFPKATGIPGGHQWSSFRGKPCWLLGGLLCTGSRGRRQCLINWLGVLGRVQEFAEGGDGEVGMRDALGGLEGAGWQGQIPCPPGVIYPTSDHVCLIYKAEGGGKCLNYLAGLERRKHAADALLHISFWTFREVDRFH